MRAGVAAQRRHRPPPTGTCPVAGTRHSLFKTGLSTTSPNICRSSTRDATARPNYLRTTSSGRSLKGSSAVRSTRRRPGMSTTPNCRSTTCSEQRRLQAPTSGSTRRSINILRSPQRVTGVTLDDGTTITAPVVVNVAGPHSYVINKMAGVYDSMKIKTRALRHEVHHVPAPEGFGLRDAGLHRHRRRHRGLLPARGRQPHTDRQRRPDLRHPTVGRPRRLRQPDQRQSVGGPGAPRRSADPRPRNPPPQEGSRRPLRRQRRLGSRSMTAPTSTGSTSPSVRVATSTRTDPSPDM